MLKSNEKREAEAVETANKVVLKVVHHDCFRELTAGQLHELALVVMRVLNG